MERHSRLKKQNKPIMEECMCSELFRNSKNSDVGFREMSDRK